MWNPSTCRTGKYLDVNTCTCKERFFDKLVLTCECGIVKTLGTVSTNFIDKKITYEKDHCLVYTILLSILCLFLLDVISINCCTTTQNPG